MTEFPGEGRASSLSSAEESSIGLVLVDQWTFPTVLVSDNNSEGIIQREANDFS